MKFIITAVLLIMFIAMLVMFSGCNENKREKLNEKHNNRFDLYERDSNRNIIR